MKKLLILLALAMTTASASGCRWFRRGQDCNTCPPTAGYPASAPYAAEPYTVSPPVTSSYVAPPG